VFALFGYLISLDKGGHSVTEIVSSVNQTQNYAFIDAFSL